MFCNNCGKNINSRITCPYCGYGRPDEYTFICTSKKRDFTQKISSDAPSRFIAGILQFFVGCVGLGRFYMKSYKIAVLQLIVTLIALVLNFYVSNVFLLCGFLWGVIDAILILSGKIEFDGKNNLMNS